MTSCSVTLMRSPTNTGIWLAKCYRDGELVETQEFTAPFLAQSFADQWLSQQLDSEE